MRLSRVLRWMGLSMGSTVGGQNPVSETGTVGQNVSKRKRPLSQEAPVTCLFNAHAPDFKS